MKTQSIVAAAILAAALTTGCEDKSKPATTSTPEKPVASATPAATAATLELSDDDVPVAEDYIEEATKEIDDKNLNAKLDELDKEISSDTE